MTLSPVKDLSASFPLAKRSIPLPADRRGRKEAISLQLTECKAAVVTTGPTRKETQQAFVLPCTH